MEAQDRVTSMFARDLARVSGEVDDSAAIPGWVRELGPRRRRWWRPLAGGLGIAAVAAAALLLVFARPDAELGLDRAAITAAKGGAEIGVYVKRGGAVFLWDTETPLRSGDAIRLKVAPAGYSHLTVFHDTGRGVTVLYQASLVGSRPVLLEAAWTLDDSGERDDIIAVLSHEPITSPDPPAPHWSRRFQLRSPENR